jgi:hypothetical protein
LRAKINGIIARFRFPTDLFCRLDKSGSTPEKGVAARFAELTQGY